MTITAADLEMVRRIARKLARRFPRAVSYDDLYSDGLLGLIEATRTFDPSRGVPFRRFAVTRIRGAMLDGIRDRRWLPRIRDPRRAIAAPRMINRNLSDVMSLDPDDDPIDRADALQAVLKPLPRRLRLVLQLSYLESLSLKQIAACLRMTEAGVCLLRKRAIEKCNSNFNEVLSSVTKPPNPLGFTDKIR